MEVKKIIPSLIRAGFEKDTETMETLALMLLRVYKKIDPNVSNEIAKILSFKQVGASSYRSVGINPSPIDEGSRFPLAKVLEPMEIEDPIFSQEVEQALKEFLTEREKAEELLKYGMKPTNSILLHGEPGVGKTYTAKWLSKQLKIPLVTIDLSAVISSYLGKTGQNIKQILEYAKSYQTILFLDEFDAIAKRRDDQSDIGELKRIVNVLLKELEEWPSNNIVIAATNHPEILDKAIWRRFDKHLELKNLEGKLHKKLIKKEMEVLEKITSKEIDFISYFVKEISPADTVKICNSIKRKYILSQSSRTLKECIIDEIKSSGILPKVNKDLCFKLYDELKGISKKEIIEITGLSQTTVYRYFRER